MDDRARVKHNTEAGSGTGRVGRTGAVSPVAEASGELRPGFLPLLKRITEQTAGLNLQLVGLGVTIVLILIVGAILSPYFLTSDNLLNVGRQVSIVALLGLAVTISLITGVIDFSVGSVLALTSVLVALNADESMIVPVALVLVMIAAASLVKGVLLAYLGLGSLITTLGLALVIDGFALGVSDSRLVPVFSEEWRFLGSGDIAGIPASVLTAAVVFLVAGFFMRSTVYGKYVYATGANPLASRIAGVPVRRVRLAALTATTAIAALAGVLFVGRVAGGDPNVGVAMSFDAVVVAVLGGASLRGGRGSVLGVLLAAILIGLMLNLFTLLNLPTYWQMVARGCILVGAISLDVAPRRVAAGT